MKSRSMQVSVQIYRHDPSKADSSCFQEYRVAADRAMTVHELLDMVYHDIDQTVAYRDYKCYIGKCGGCMTKINGKKQNACETQVKPGESIVLEPVYASREENIKDLVCRFS